MPRNPKIKNDPPFRQPTHICDPASFDKMSLRFRFDLLDFDHDLWGWEKLSAQQYINFLKFVRDVEKQTWAEIKLAAGGKRQGTNHHPLEITRFSKNAQKRLQELNLQAIVGDTIFSLRLNNVTRVYGIREIEFFRPIWHDPYHDQADKAAYPLK